MKEFFVILFGGLILVFGGIALSWSAGMLWNKLPTDKFGITFVLPVQTIRYTANEEEDVINSAIAALPRNGQDRITAKAYLVKNLETGTVFAEYQSDKLLPAASLTKLITAVVASRYIPPSTEIEITPEIITTFGNTASFKAGEIFSAPDLLYPLLMVSSNDAAEAYAEKYGRDAFIKKMNEFAQSIGAYRTKFADPSGLSDENVTSAGDLALIADWIRKNEPDLFSITALKTKTIRNHVWVNPTHFLSWSYYLGGKNGYTDNADRTSVSLFALGYKKETYAVAVLGSEDRDSDVIRLINKVK